MDQAQGVSRVTKTRAVPQFTEGTRGAGTLVCYRYVLSCVFQRIAEEFVARLIVGLREERRMSESGAD